MVIERRRLRLTHMKSLYRLLTIVLLE